MWSPELQRLSRAQEMAAMPAGGAGDQEGWDALPDGAWGQAKHHVGGTSCLPCSQN